jgi:hypothetical protein
MVGGME